MPDISNANENDQNRPLRETVSEPEYETRSTQQILPEETPEDLNIEDITSKSQTVESLDEQPFLEESSSGGGSSKYRKYVFLLAGIFGALVLFMGIFFIISRFTREESAITLEFWDIWEDENIYKPLIEEYQRKNPNVTIQYVKKDKEAYREKLVTQILDGRGPDIFTFHNTWLPQIIQATAPLPSTVYSREDYENTFYDVIVSDMTYGNDLYGIALGIDGLMLVYNDTLFKQAGLNGAPRTWDDLLTSAYALRVADVDKNILTSGIALGTSNNIEHFSDIFGWLLIINGASLNDLSSPEAVEVLSIYRSFAEPENALWNSSIDNNINAFVQGKLGMVIVPSWQVLEIIKANPEIQIKTAPLPTLPGIDPVSIASYWPLGVSSASPHQLEAWKFIAFLSEKENVTKLFTEQAKYRPFGVPYSRVDLRDTIIENEFIGPIAEQAPNMKSLPLNDKTFDNGLNDGIKDYLGTAIDSAEKGVAYGEAMAGAAQGVNSLLNEYNIK